MSLTGWVYSDPALFDELINLVFSQRSPFLPWLSSSQALTRLRAEPHTTNYGLLGTAFDYAMRMRLVQINHLSPDALTTSGRLIAELGIQHNARRIKFIHRFKAKWAAIATSDHIDDLLAECLVLANLDAVYRSGSMASDSEVFHVLREDIEDLSALVAAIDPITWKSSRQCTLNPTFGGSSLDVGGADADVILDGTLIDIKTVKSLDVRQQYLRQIVGYYILNLREQDEFQIKALGIYFSRHGVLWAMPVRLQPIPDDADIWVKIEKSIEKYSERSARLSMSDFLGGPDE